MSWREAGHIGEFNGQDRKIIDAGDGRRIVLFKIADEYWAINNRCSHENASLALGDRDGYEIMCPLHGSRFDIRTGKNLSLPAVEPVDRFDVKVEDGRIFVQIGT